MNISILLPTRKRIPLLKKAVGSLINNAREPEKLQFLFGVDTDDEETFNFLKETNNLDLKKKKEIQIREESNNMKEELKKLPETIRDKLSDAIENEKLRIEANNAINEAKNQEKKWKYYRKLRKYLCIL